MTDAATDAGLPPPPDPPAGSGEYRVGYRVIDWQYTRPDGETRETKLHLWYPTDEERGRSVTYVGFLPDPHTFDAPSLATPPASGFPVHVHSHGSRGFGPASFDLMRHLASHGYVSIAPDHVGNLLLDPVPVPVDLHYIRAWDITAALDALSSLPSDDPLKDNTQTEEVALSSHSFGVMTAWALSGVPFDSEVIGPRCESGDVPSPCTEADLTAFARDNVDSRIRATIMMAGRYHDEWFGVDGYQSVNVPVLALTGSEDDVGVAGFFERITGIDYTWVDISGACHTAFSIGACDNIADRDAWTVINTYALAFFERHLAGDETQEPILDGTTSVSPLASLERRMP